VHLLALQNFNGQLTALLVTEHDNGEATAVAFLVGRQGDVLDVGKGHKERADIVGSRLAIQIPDIDLEHAHRDPPGWRRPNERTLASAGAPPSANAIGMAERRPASQNEKSPLGFHQEGP
jgi:hypothetical protein